eukprot:1152364-Prymnesium_polylepis.1
MSSRRQRQPGPGRACACGWGGASSQFCHGVDMRLTCTVPAARGGGTWWVQDAASHRARRDAKREAIQNGLGAPRRVGERDTVERESPALHHRCGGNGGR